MSHLLFRSATAAALLALAAGCATLGDSTQQQLEVHTILDNREVAGVGCVLENDAGRWFVVAPGRVTVDRSQQPLSIVCKRQGVGAVSDYVGSRFDTDKLIGNAVTTAGLGYYVDRRSGAGFSYPSTLTLILRAPQEGPGAGATEQATADNPVF
jgi:hypothetical protein